MSLAETILHKLVVRSGLQPTTYNVRDDQHHVCVHFFYDRNGEAFKLRVFWEFKAKTIEIPREEVYSKSKSQWTMDKTFRLTDAAIERLAPGLQALLDAIEARLGAETKQSA